MATARVVVDGKFFSVDGRRFPFRGVTYGTFRCREDTAAFPDRDRMKRDFAAISDAGFTVVRTYTPPPDDALELAADWGLRLFPEAFYLDWRYLVGTSRRDQSRMLRDARAAVRAEARRLAGLEQVVAVSVGNEVPADVVRWFGTDRVARTVGEMVEIVHEEDPDLLVTYANYPTTEYLPLPDVDFVTFNVFLERQVDFRRYLTRLHNITGERPLVLGEIGFDASRGEELQAVVLDWQLETAMERGVAGSCLFSWTDDWWVDGRQVPDWHFGLTREDRSPRPALEAASEWNQRTVADLDVAWPSMTVVICAYNEEATIDECLRHACALDYPNLEILVVDDGSTDATPAIASRYPRARVLTIEHGGLGAARNVGYAEATGDIVAYLDSDAYPTREWPFYLALGIDGERVGAVGGPNLSPVDDSRAAQMVSSAPGGPVHVLLGDDRAEHVPGCNMAIRKDVLTEVGGFDPVYTAAGDDVDVCWKLLDADWEIAFHPAAVVWHHRRSGVRAYLRQQAGYGRAEALVQARHPHRFTHLGSARWRGRIYGTPVPPLARESIYRGRYGAAAYQSVYQGGGHAFDLAHQVGIPLAVGVVFAAPLVVVWAPFAAAVTAALVGLLGLWAVDAIRVRPPTETSRRLGFRLGVATMHVVQPLWRQWARRRANGHARRELVVPAVAAGRVQRRRRGVIVVPVAGPRAELAAALVAALRRAGYPVDSPIGWEDHDATVPGSLLVEGHLVTSAYPAGWMQIRMRRRLRAVPVAAVVLAAGALALVGETSATAVVGVVAACSLARGGWRVGPRARRVMVDACGGVPVNTA